MEVRGRVAIVTGAGSGIGRATALRLAQEGAAVIVADLNGEDGTETVRLIEERGGTARFYWVDVTDEPAVERMVAFAEETFGGLDILHNNAGIITGARFPEAPSARWQRTLDINLRGVILGTYYAIPAMKRHGGGVIIQTASMAGLAPYATDAVYAATKAGVVNFTRSLAFLKEEANIRVNCVCPGLVDTNIGLHARGPMTPEEREAFERQRAERIAARPRLAPSDVAEAVMQLIQDDSLAGCAYRIAAGQPWELL
jgi:NAD(P)-dependent dehydrogenase (short-subunit alcohol dehydrogenase family)